SHMKKILLIIVLVISWPRVIAQIEERETANWQIIGQLKFGGITKAKMQYVNYGKDTTYMLFIKDVRDQPKNNYFGITFKGIDGTYNKLYTILKSFFLPENKKDKKYSRTFNLGNAGVNVQHYRLITGRGIMFYTKDGYTYWSEKDIDKLFGQD
ncbi:MAG: hypothetical protein ACXWC7_02175, partial [Chitinophagaceae bacterium]